MPIHQYEDLPGGMKWPSHRRKKQITERVVRDNFFNGFMAGLQGGERSDGLGYSSTSGLYGYNPVRQIAHRAGWDFAKEILALQEKAKTDRRYLFTQMPYKIPATVWAECYAEMRLGA